MPKVKGQNCVLKLIVDGSVVQEADSFVSLEETRDGELIEDEYLGEVTKDYDELFHGYKLNITGHMRRADWLVFDDQLSQRMKYQSGGLTKVDLMQVITFPDTGEIRTTTYLDLKAGPRRVNYGSRSDRAEFSIELGCKEKVTQ